MKNTLRLLMVLTLLLCNSCDQSNSQLFDLILEIKSQNDQLLNEVKTLQLKSDLLISELRASAAKQEELLVKVTELQGQLSTILSQIDVLNQQLKTQDADVQLIKNQLAGLQTQYQGIFKQLEELQKLSQILAEIEKMKTQISQLDTRYTTILSGLAQNKQQLDALKTQITSVQGQLAENLAKIAQFTVQLGDQGVVIANILKQIDLLKANNAELIKLMESLLIGKSPVPTDGLVGWWPFNGNANDESGNGNNGIRNQVAETEDRFGKPGSAFYFDGISSYIDLKISNMPINNSPRTIAGWFKADLSLSIGSKHNICIFNYGEPEALKRLSLFLYSKGYLNTINGSKYNNEDNITIQNNYIDNKWHFFALVYDGSKLELFINGESSQRLVKLNTTNTVFRIAQNTLNNGINENFKGSIDDISMYNKALSNKEITSLYKSTGN